MLNWPKQYDIYKLTALSTRTRFGGHGGSEALPEQKIERDPRLKRMFLGYAFSIDYRDRRGHAYMLQDQTETERQTQHPERGRVRSPRSGGKPPARLRRQEETLTHRDFRLSWRQR